MLSKLAYRRLTEMIYAGQLQPGERIVERRLARQLGISRIPLREGLARLESEGLVRSGARRATFVEDFGPEDALEIYSMRLLLEPFAAQLAADRHHPSLIKRLRSLMARMTENSSRGDFRRLGKTDYAFHLAIVRASHHKRLIRAYESCHVRIVPVQMSIEYLLAQPPESTTQEHDQITTAIEQGRGKDAERAMRSHVVHATERLQKAQAGN